MNTKLRHENTPIIDFSGKGGMALRRAGVLALLLCLLLAAAGCRPARSENPPADADVTFTEAEETLQEDMEEGVYYQSMPHDRPITFRIQRDIKVFCNLRVAGYRDNSPGERKDAINRVLKVLPRSFFREKAVVIVPLVRDTPDTRCTVQSMRTQGGKLIVVVEKSAGAADADAQDEEIGYRAYYVDASAIACITGAELEIVNN